MIDNLNDLNDETRDAWEGNAQVWDARMGDEGNDFFNLLCWPAITRLLNAQPNQHILDIACGNGLTTRRLAEIGATVTAFDFSANLINFAKSRLAQYESQITLHVMDATDETALISLGERKFDSALSNMALFDIADLEPLFRTMPKLLKPNGVFVFAITHPALNNASAAHVAEEVDENGVIKNIYSVKISRYMTPYHQRGLALYSQPKPQVYFERPLQYYLNLGFENGLVLDGFEERALPPETPQKFLEWGGKFSEIPPVLVGRFRLPS
jgi:2-polyprenyl-3-methyl-5-hydroxy-6-metoxy-1,4-benzoquinol methylase